MSKITGKVTYKEVLKGDTGYTFEPHVTVDGILYWTNNGNLENPLPVNLHGKQGFMFIPHVDSEGNLSWSNNGELENPPTVNIKGDKGYFYTPHISEDGILSWSNNGNLENPQPFNISDLILNEVKESRVDTTGKTFSKLKERLDSDFKKLSESIKNNDTKDEVVQARTATTGEKFNTLDERIDCEVERLNKKIEVSMLQQEEAESHTILNTVEGMTTDMVIRGKTLQNLASNTPAKNAANVQIEKLLKSEMFKVGTTYTVNIPNRNNKQIIIVVKNKEGVTKNIILSSTTNTFTVEEDYPIVFRLTLHNTNGWDVNNDLVNADKAIVVEGNNVVLNSFFEGIKSFGEVEGNKISILSHGKNFFNINEFSEKINEKGELEFKADGNSRINSYFVIFTENNSLSQKILVAGGTGEKQFTTLNQEEYFIYIGLNGDKKDDKVWGKIVLPRNTTCYISTSSVVENNNTVRFKDIQIETGTSKSSYEEYTQDKKDILLHNLGFDEGLRGINSISDEINYIRKVAIKRIGKREYRDGDLLLDNVITNKVNTYYVLDELIETPLNENINVKTFNDKTYVNFENSINGTSSFKEPVNTNKLINDLKFEKEDLKEKFNNLTNEFENFKTYMIQTLPYKGV
ncbi:hypothetical protein [Clostridium phage cpp]|uniref:Uncharacterized protein n=1 Tax=Clostridium phage cpp TaxID=3042444 RepID=A0AAF0GW57_9CAUD|nr:hypothetical protein [Clostridium phage cpp]